jgi:ABC-2 type transport system permease protein
MRALYNILHLGIKELISLRRDPMLVAFIVFAFTVSIYTAAAATPETVNKAPIAIIDDDRSQLSGRIVSAFYPPSFIPTIIDGPREAELGLDAGRYTFALHIPAEFQRDVLDGRAPSIQLIVDATRMSQSFAGSGQIQTIVNAELQEFIAGFRGNTGARIDLVLRARFNPELNASWFGAMAQLINQITMLAIILTGAALLREREHGTVEHLLVMPVTPLEIMTAKVWSMGLVVLFASAVSLLVVVRGWLAVPIEGSSALFLAGAALHLFATTSMGIMLATFSRSMPQFGLLLILVIVPIQILSGSMTPRESMPDLIQSLMLLAPNTHFVILGQAILYRGAGLSIVWPQFLAIAAIGAAFFVLALMRFRKTISM